MRIESYQDDVMAHSADTLALIERLKMLPYLFDLDNQTQVAAAIGVSYKTWHHSIRTGDVSFPTAKAIVRALPGCDLDWLTFGTEDGLSMQLARKIARYRQSQTA